jgi:hypothetical protein
MVSPLFFYQLVLIALVWLCVMLQWVWPSAPAAACSTTPKPPPPQPKRQREPKPFEGLTTKPHCDACAQASDLRPEAPCPPPPRIVPTRGRRRQVDTSTHFCPNPNCAYRAWVGWGNLRANGHPNGGPWRQLLCVVCRRSFLETLGTLFHGKRVSVELIVRVIACLAEGLGIRGTARVFEVDANTVLQWLVDAAEQLRAFSQHVLHDVRVQQVQLDEFFALLSAVKDGEVSEPEAIARLERMAQWVWVAMDPESMLLLAIDVESREMLGIVDQLRYNGLDHSPATRTRRSSCMRVKLQLVMCSDEGQEETVTDVITLNKNSQRIEHLGLTMAEAKQLLSTLQQYLLQQQVNTFLDRIGKCIFPAPQVPKTHGEASRVRVPGCEDG